VLASLVFSLMHVAGMVALRVLAYRWQGGNYDFGPWGREFLYEYLKDIRSFTSMVVGIEVYRFLLRRWQGEASLLDVPDEGPPVEPVERPERFLVRKLGREFLVAAADIEWLQAAGNYVNLRVRGHDYPLRSTIAGVEAKLDPQRFARIHRSYMVNLDHVVSIEPLESGDARLYLKDGTMLPCSRRYRSELRDRVGND
jgi:DNA-binding LytR/AlgR family response regulator